MEEAHGVKTGRGGRRSPSSCRTKSCIGVMKMTKHMRSGLVYKSMTFGFLTWAQAAIGLTIIAIYVFLYAQPDLSPTHLQRTEPTSKIPLNVGAGIVAAGIQILAAAVTLLAFHEVNYCWLHLATSLHILNVLAQSLLSLHLIMLAFPGVLTGSNTVNTEEFEAQPEVTQGPALLIGPYWKGYSMMVVSACSLASIFIGSFLAAATGYAVCCGLDSGEKRKSSFESDRKLLKKCVRRERKLVKFDSFEPSNVAANLDVGVDEENPIASLQDSIVRSENSLIYINRHARDQ